MAFPPGVTSPDLCVRPTAFPDWAVEKCVASNWLESAVPVLPKACCQRRAGDKAHQPTPFQGFSLHVLESHAEPRAPYCSSAPGPGRSRLLTQHLDSVWDGGDSSAQDALVIRVPSTEAPTEKAEGPLSVPWVSTGAGSLLALKSPWKGFPRPRPGLSEVVNQRDPGFSLLVDGHRMRSAPQHAAGPQACDAGYRDAG